MRFDCELSWRERLYGRRERREQWHPWFAWRPVRVADSECVWLERIERKGRYWYLEGWCWEYRVKPSATSKRRISGEPVMLRYFDLCRNAPSRGKPEQKEGAAGGLITKDGSICGKNCGCGHTDCPFVRGQKVLEQEKDARKQDHSRVHKGSESLGNCTSADGHCDCKPGGCAFIKTDR